MRKTLGIVGNVTALTLYLWKQRNRHAENTLADAGAWHKARIIPNIRCLDFSDVQIPSGLRHEAPLVWDDEVGEVVVDPAEQHLTWETNKTTDRNEISVAGRRVDVSINHLYDC